MSHTATHPDPSNAADGRSGIGRLSPQAFDGGGPPAERANLDDQIYARIKAMIVDGTLLSGERIVPEQLARDMGVSRIAHVERPQAPLPGAPRSPGVRDEGCSCDARRSVSSP